jgi:hypothetical protein
MNHNEPTSHDIYVRAHAIQPETQKHGTARENVEPRWPDSALIFDCESRITAEQTLTCGFWRFCELQDDRYRCEPLTDLSYPVVLPQGGESRGDRFIESLRSNLYGVLNVSKISDRNRARSKNHVQEGSIFSFCSPWRAVAIYKPVRGE